MHVEGEEEDSSLGPPPQSSLGMPTALGQTRPRQLKVWAIPATR
jgi:hypothetical protein